MGLPQTMDINVTHRYAHIVDKYLCLTYDSMGVQLTETLEFCDGWARSKEDAHAVRKKRYTGVTKL